MLLDRIIRAWKDPEFRLSLSQEEQDALPENPAGAIELTDDELDMVTGGHAPSYRVSHSNNSNSNSNSAARSYSSNSNSSARSNNSNSNSSARSNNSNSASRSHNSNSSSRSHSSRSSRSYAWRRPR